MRQISLSIGNQYIYYALFEKDRNIISLIESGRIAVLQNQSPSYLMDYIHTTINNLLINKNINNVIIIIPSSNANINTPIMTSQIMTSGVATLSCFEKGLAVDYKSTSNIKPKKLGFTGKIKKDIILKSIDTVFPNMTYKNNDMRKTVLLGYEELL